MSGHDGDSNDTLVVPFVWVPDDAPEPTEWLMQHPDAVRVPATFEPDEPSASVREQQAARSDDPDTTNDRKNASVAGEQFNGSTSPASNNPRRRPSGYWLTAAGAGRTDPVEAYHRADNGLSRTDPTQPAAPGDATESESEPGGSLPPETPFEATSEDKTTMPDAAAHANGLDSATDGSISEQDASAGSYPQSPAAIQHPADLQRSLQKQPGRPAPPACS